MYLIESGLWPWCYHHGHILHILHLLGFLALFLALVLASFAFGFAALLTFVVAGAVALVHVAGLLNLGGVAGGVDSLFGGFVVVASNHGHHGKGCESGKQNFFHCFDV